MRARFVSPRHYEDGRMHSTPSAAQGHRPAPAATSDGASAGVDDWRRWGRDLAIWSFVFALATAILMLFMDHEPGGVYTRMLAAAAWFDGGPKPEVVTYPMWGLAVVLWLTGSTTVTTVLQVIACAIALAALSLRLRRELSEGGTLLVIFLLLCLPWYVMAMKPYANGFAQAFMVFGLLAAERAWRRDSLRDAIVAGVLFGIGQNFRSELVLLPGFSLVLLSIFKRTPRWRSARILGATTLVALLFQVPWAVHFYKETGRPKLTESTSWAVLYGALGQLPDNPWGIEAQDAFLQEVMRQEGHSFDGLSDQAGEVFKARFVAAVKAHPTVVPRVWAYRIMAMARAPFFAGQIDLTPQEREGLDVVRERFKLKFGIAPNHREIKAYRESGEWDRPASLAQNAAFGFELLSQGLLVLFFLAVLMGIALTLRAGRLWRSDSALLALLLSPIVFKLLLGVFLTYRHDYLNSISVFCIPFALVALSRLPRVRFRWAGEAGRS